MAWLIELINRKSKEQFTGAVRINFFRGGISNINVEESIKVPGGCSCNENT